MKTSKLSPPSAEMLEELDIELPPENQTRTNPFTGVSHILTPQACQIYDFITTKIWTCGVDYTRKEWDNARYYFLQEWPKEYFDLID